MVAFDCKLREEGRNPRELYLLRQAQGLFKKLEDLDVGADKAANGYQKFLMTESRCRETNEFFRGVLRGTVSLVPSVNSIFTEARKHIRRVLGPAPKLGDLKFRFGPGATANTPKKEACATEKLARGLSCSNELLSSGLLPELFRQVPHWLDALDCPYEIREDAWTGEEWWCHIAEVTVEYGNLTFVPKNCEISRPVDPQPTLNSMGQAALGDYIKRRLAASGLYLDSDAYNRTSAREGSISGKTATTDLEGASDTIAKLAIKFFFPEDWYRLLDAFCSRTTEYDGEVIHMEKFAAQGNGFTFPVESLVFWALARAASAPENRHLVNTYGDDIISHTDDVAAIWESLEAAGFVVNVAKSYADGPFRESCGGDYYLGYQCRPYYHKTLVSAQSLYVLSNYLWRRGEESIATYIRSFIPVDIRLYGPDGYGDGVLVSDQFNVEPTTITGGAGVYFSVYQKIGRFVRTKYPGDWVSPLYHVYVSDSKPMIPEFYFLDLSFRARRRALDHFKKVRSKVMDAAAPWKMLPLAGTLMDASPTDFDRNGFPLWDLPGVELQPETKEEAYERRKI